MERCAASVIQGSAVASRGGAGPDCNVVWFLCIKADDATPCGQALDLAVRRASLSLTAKGLCSLHRGHGSSRGEARATVSGLMKVIHKLDKGAQTGGGVVGGRERRRGVRRHNAMLGTNGDQKNEGGRPAEVGSRSPGQDRTDRNSSSNSGVLLSLWCFGVDLVW